ncbi:MAG: hypothetical protein C0613_00625 [Desulfobulbaceae bacterium]|nr:MAG: hypothetical protein C0613_00625 [Desulfobulbaceae bacterium]
MRNVLSGGSRLQRFFLWAAIALLVYSLCGFFVLPALLRYALVKKVPPVLQRQLVIDKVYFNPYTLHLRMQGLQLAARQGDGHFVAFDELAANLQIVSLFKRAIIVKSFSVSGPRIYLCRNLDKSYNFSDLLQGAADAPQEGSEPGHRPLLFSINNIEIADGEIILDDRPKESRHEIAALHLTMPAISNLPYNVESYVQPSFAALVNGSQLDLAGMSKPFADSQETTIDLRMSGIDIPSYLAYIPNETGLILHSGLVDLDVEFSYVAGDGNGSRLALTGELVVRDVEVLDDAQHSYLRLPRLTLEFGDANLLDKKVHLKRVVLQDMALQARRLESGDLLPLAYLAKGDQDGEGAETPSVPQETESDQPAVTLTVDLLEMVNASARFHDAASGAARPSVQELTNFNLQLSNFSTSPDSMADIDLAVQVNEIGSIRAQGRVSAVPPAARLDFEVADLAVKPYQPYIQQHVHVAIADGTLASRGILEARRAEGELLFTLQGEARLDEFNMVDTVQGDTLLAWQSVAVQGLDFDSQAHRLRMDEVALHKIKGKVVIFANGSTNIASLSTAAPEEQQRAAVLEEEGAGNAQPLQVMVDLLRVDGGAFEFVDKKVTPFYGATIEDVSGTIAGLSSVRQSQATVEISGRINQHAPLEVRGKINPLQDDIFVDLQVDVGDLDLSHITPYTGTYLGYKTEKGKLNLGLNYLVENRELAGKNKVFLDQFTLGETVESPDDINLPVSLAIALLQNRKGEIHLDIPVAGNLDDPEFSLGGVIVKVLINLVAKAATSPFALLGSLIPEGEDLQTIAFAAGSSELSPEAADKVETLAHVLYERPALKMSLTGQVDREGDRQALAEQLFEQMVKLRKLQEAKKPSAAKAEVKDVALSPEEYSRIIQEIYSLRLKAAGRPAADPVPTDSAMREFILADLEVPDDQLRLLALARANQVVHSLVETGKVDAGRLFVVEPQGLGSQQEDGAGALVHVAIK